MIALNAALNDSIDDNDAFIINWNAIDNYLISTENAININADRNKFRGFPLV